MAQDLINNDLYVNGNLSARSLTPPASSITDNAVQGAAGIQASKLQHQHQPVASLSDYATAAAVARRVLHVVRGGTAQLQDFKVGAAVAAVGNATVTIDLKKNGTTILSASITLDSTTAAFALKGPAGYSSSSFVQNDVLEVDVSAVAPGTGTLPKGLFAALNLREDAQ